MVLMLMYVPIVYFSFLTYKFLYSAKAKGDKTHKTKIALALLALACLMLIILNLYVYGVFNKELAASFWLNASFYFVMMGLINFYCYYMVRKSNSRKNITKLAYFIVAVLIYLPSTIWCYRVFSVGVYGGNFGVSKTLAYTLVEADISPSLNRQILSAEKVADSWEVKAAVSSRDGKIEVEKKYGVNIADGVISQDGAQTSLNLLKNGSSIEAVEMMLFEGKAGQNGQWVPVDYMISDANGKASAYLKNSDDIQYFLQARDCSLICQDFYYKLSIPLKGAYNIELDVMQTGVVSL